MQFVYCPSSSSLHTDFHAGAVSRMPNWKKPMAAMVCIEGSSSSKETSVSAGSAGPSAGSTTATDESAGASTGAEESGRSRLRVQLAATGQEHYLTIPPSHILVWAGDVPHSGTGYDALNVRCFAYVDQREHVRVPDTTFRVRKKAKRKKVKKQCTKNLGGIRKKQKGRRYAAVNATVECCVVNATVSTAE